MTHNQSDQRATSRFTIAIFFTVALLNVSLIHAIDHSSEKWKRAQKTDGIETFYRTEKSGTDTFDVDIKVHNTRAKPIKATIRVEYKPGNETELENLTNIVAGNSSRQTPVRECTVTVQPKSSSECQTITVRTKKIKGVMIKEWNVAD